MSTKGLNFCPSPCDSFSLARFATRTDRFAPFRRRFGLVAWAAQGLEVVIVLGAAICTADHVVNLVRRLNPTRPCAQLAKVVITLEDSSALDAPGMTVIAGGRAA